MPSTCGPSFQAVSPFSSSWRGQVLQGEARRESFSQSPFSDKWNLRQKAAAGFPLIHDFNGHSRRARRRLDGHCCRCHEVCKAQKSLYVKPQADFQSVSPFDSKFEDMSLSASARNSMFAVSPFSDNFRAKVLRGQEAANKLKNRH